MPVSLQNRLQQHEVVPPPFVWDKISVRLDEEFVTGDSQISERLENTVVAPPPSTWNKISPALQNDDIKERPARVIPLSYRRGAIAVIIAGVMAVGAMYLFTGNKDKPPFNKSEIVKTDQVNPSPSPRNSTEGLTEEKDTSPEKTLIASSKVRRSATAISRRSPNEPSSFENNPSQDIEQVHVEDIQTVPALQPISVSAPPLRDARGNIIMDLGLISDPSDPYIVVTGPNGKQTKISNKFLNCLSYINGNFSSSDIDSEGMECKTRFEEWRKKLLSDAAFIPTANNFFDIFELKDMIQDR